MKFTYTGVRVKEMKRSIEFYTKKMSVKGLQRGKMRVKTYN